MSVPTIDQIIDALIVRSEAISDRTEYDALRAALGILEDYRAERNRMEALTTMTEISIAVRRHTRKATR